MSPVVKAAEMMSVLSISPMMIRTVCARRRAKLRIPMRNMTRLRRNTATTLARERPSNASRTNMILVIGMPKRVSLRGT